MWQLANVIRVLSPWSVQCSVSVKSYKEIVAPHLTFGLESLYFALFYAKVYGIAKFHKELGVSVPVDIIFDEQGRLGLEALMFYELMRPDVPSDIRGRIGASPIFRDEKHVLPLQAADMLAWHIRRQSEGSPARDYEGVLDILRVPGLHAMYDVDDDMLREIAAGAMNIPQEGRPRSKAEWKAVRRLMLSRPIDGQSNG